jgi:hypothetical protein
VAGRTEFEDTAGRTEFEDTVARPQASRTVWSLVAPDVVKLARAAVMSPGRADLVY